MDVMAAVSGPNTPISFTVVELKDIYILLELVAENLVTDMTL